MGMAIQTFEYCSLYYLNQWLKYDRGYCDALSGNDNDRKVSALKKAAGFYRVARNLRTEDKEASRYQPVLDILDSIDPKKFKGDQNKNIVDEIKNVESRISKIYGGRNVLSLTTKFLWLKVKSPIVIYDSQAREAVGAKNNDLDDYYEKWKDQFDNYEKKIESACSKLPDMHLYAVNHEAGTKKYIIEHSSEPWFSERVFDIYLWHKGTK